MTKAAPKNKEDASPVKERTGRTTVTFKEDPLRSEARVEATERTKRKKLVLGRIVHTFPNGTRKIGSIVHHMPSPFASQTEAIYFKGPPGSGKSWGAYSFAGQSFFGENRSWVIIDTKLSYLGNNRPNLIFQKEIEFMGGVPCGIPGSQMDVIAPRYYVNGLSREELKDTWVTDYYLLPLRFCNLGVMFELTKSNKKAGYASSFDTNWKDLMITHRNRPSLQHVFDMIDTIIQDDDMKRMQWVYKMLKKKITEIAALTIDDRNEWSSIGKALKRAAEERRARWVVFTLAHSPNPEDDMNLALVSTVLTELHVFAEWIRHDPDKYPDFQLGVMIDELHLFVRDKDSSTSAAIHDLLFFWGRSSKVMRIFLTQKDEQLDKVFQDDIGKKISDVGTYQCVVSCSAIPEPGYVTYINRVQPNPMDADSPLYYPKVKTLPPLFEVESDEPNDERWRHKLMQRMEKRWLKQQEDMADVIV